MLVSSPCCPRYYFWSFLLLLLWGPSKIERHGFWDVARGIAQIYSNQRCGYAVNRWELHWNLKLRFSTNRNHIYWRRDSKSGLNIYRYAYYANQIEISISTVTSQNIITVIDSLYRISKLRQTKCTKNFWSKYLN